ncbi:MAG TPA: type II toxin-antitoxin system RelE/ParE family toxin [Ignavibacteria bacterium]|nr:type II toxin-antitoxin system RelE/ParE family toxin [Ignavibacteria bacterium]
MIIKIEKSFERDVAKINDKIILSKLSAVITNISAVSSQKEIPNLKKLSGNQSYYRIKINNYRIGISITGNEIIFIRFLHRKEVYRYFP